VAENTMSFYDKIKHLAEEMGLEGEEADNFINQSMEKKGGHKKVVTWIPDDGKGEGGQPKAKTWF